MSELTDLQICKRIAEIEGYPQQVMGHGTVIISTATEHTIGHWKEYNPLTDDALCFQLMVTHRISVDIRKDGRTQAFMDCENSTECVTDESPSKAILLA